MTEKNWHDCGCRCKDRSSFYRWRCTADAGQKIDIHSTTVAEVMTSNCAVISADILAAEAMQIMEQKKINALIVVDDQRRPIGALNMHDLIHAGIV
jgi:arabinose-5-phosphate isomerase